MRKVRREDWFAAGRCILEADGFSRLTIDALCTSLKMTKGSFYHHFRNMDGYIVAFMQHWVEEYSLEFICKAEAQRFAGGRGELLARLAFELCGKMERGIRAWASASPLVRIYLHQVDGIRLKYLESLMPEDPEGEPSRGAARLEYALMVGIQQLYPELSREELLEIYKLRA